MRSWWRSNRWFLVALAVALPVAVVVSMIPRWFPYVERQPQAEHVSRGDTVRYSGADIQLTGLRVLDGVEWNAPAGADIVVATFSIDVVEPAQAHCQVSVISDEAGFERAWRDEAYIPGDYDVDDDAETLCSFAEAGSYELELTFRVPAGQVTDPVVEISSSAELPRVLRLS